MTIPIVLKVKTTKFFSQMAMGSIMRVKFQSWTNPNKKSIHKNYGDLWFWRGAVRTVGRYDSVTIRKYQQSDYEKVGTIWTTGLWYSAHSQVKMSLKSHTLKVIYALCVLIAFQNKILAVIIVCTSTVVPLLGLYGFYFYFITGIWRKEFVNIQVQ